MNVLLQWNNPDLNSTPYCTSLHNADQLFEVTYCSLNKRRKWIMLSCESKSMWLPKLPCYTHAYILTHTHLCTEPLAFRGQSGNGGENRRKRGISAFFPPQLLPTFCELPPLSPHMNLHTRKQRSFPGRPSFCRHSATFPVSIKTGQIYYQSFWNRISAVQQRIRPLLL